MTESNKFSQEAVIKDALIARQVGRARERLVQVQGEGATIVDEQVAPSHQQSLPKLQGMRLSLGS